MSHRRTLAALLFSAMAALPANRVPPQKKDKTTKPAAIDKLPSGEKQWVQRWMKPMSLHDQIAQLIVIVSYGESPGARTAAYRDFVHQVRDVHVGGIIVNNRVVHGSVRNAEPYAM